MRNEGHLSNPESQKRLAKLERRKQRQYDDDLKAIMQSAAGRRFVHRLLFDTLRVMDFTPTNVALDLARHEGIRSAGVFLTNEVRRVAHSEFVHMQREQLEAQQADDVQRENAKDTEGNEHGD